MRSTELDGVLSATVAALAWFDGRDLLVTRCDSPKVTSDTRATVWTINKAKLFDDKSMAGQCRD